MVELRNIGCRKEGEIYSREGALLGSLWYCVSSCVCISEVKQVQDVHLQSIHVYVCTYVHTVMLYYCVYMHIGNTGKCINEHIRTCGQ